MNMEWVWPFAVIAMVVAARLALARARWFRPGHGTKLVSRSLELIDRVALSPQHSLHLVRLAGKAWIIAAHAGGCTLLASIPWDETQQGIGERGMKNADR
jgi:flagellar biogenesis protein FliO